MPLRKGAESTRISKENSLSKYAHVHSRANCQCAIITISQPVTNSAQKIQKLSHHYYKIKKEYY